jgi:predicted nucleic acid-binding protein
MTGRAFVDTNVWVYCFDAGQPRKREMALRIIDGAGDDELVISTQVLQEFYVNVVRKLAQPLSEDDAEKVVRELALLPIVHLDVALVFAAVGTSRRHRLSLWDALILHAAVAGGCTRLLSEDLKHGFTFEGVTVENPFRA